MQSLHSVDRDRLATARPEFRTRALGVLALLLLVAGCGGGGRGGGGGIGNSGNPPAAPEPVSTVSVSIAEVEEGSHGGTTEMQFLVALDEANPRDVRVDYTVAHDTTEPTDLVDTEGSLVVPAGATEASLSIGVVADTGVELDEEFRVVLGNPSANAVIGAGEGRGRILDDDILLIALHVVGIQVVDLNIQGPSVDIEWEFDLATLLARLRLDYDVYFQASEYHVPVFLTTGSIIITPGTGSARITLDVPPGAGGIGIGGSLLFEVRVYDHLGEPVPPLDFRIEAPIDEQVVAPDYARLSVNNEAVTEGDPGDTTAMVFTAVLDRALTTPVTLSYLTADVTAIAPGDYDAASGSVTITAGETRAEFTVTVNGDDEVEGVEGFVVPLRLDSGAAVLQRTRATGFINDDDRADDFRRVSVQDAEIVEGDSGTRSMVFEVTLDEPAQTPVSFTFATDDDSGTLDDAATAGSDYEPSSGTRFFQAGERRLTIEVPVFGDTEAENDETFLLRMTGTSANAEIARTGRGKILSDDPLTRVGIADLALAEGDAGETTTFAFTVTLSEPLAAPLVLDYTTEDVTADAGADYTAAASSIIIAAGETSGVIEVVVEGDDEPEDDEAFRVVLSTASTSALMDDERGTGTILNDDSDGWAGAELVHRVGANALWPQVAFGPGAERHVIFAQGSGVWARRSTAHDVWSDAERVGSIPIGSQAFPRLAIDDAGRGIAAWPDGDVVASSALEPGAGWQAESLPAPVEVSQQVSLAGDPVTGVAILLWDEPGNAANGNFRSVRSSRYVPGNGWQDPDLVEVADGDAFNAELALASNGEVMTVFHQPPDATGFTDVVAYRLVAGVWQGPVVLDSVDTEHAGSPKIDMNAAGDAAVAWYQPEPVASGIARRSIYVNRYDAASAQWSGAVLVESDLTHDARDPDVAIDGDGNVFVVWLQQSPDYSTEDVMANRYDASGGTWSGPQLLELDDTATGFFNIAGQQVVADDLGNAIAVWAQSDGVRQNLRAARYTASDGGWQPTELLEESDSGDAAGPHIAIRRATGEAMVVWHQRELSLWEIRANRYRP